MSRLIWWLWAAGAATVGADDSYTPGQQVEGDFEGFARVFLDKNCIDCHDDVTTRGDLNLLDLGPIDETNAAVWEAVWAQVTLKEMPPKDRNKQPETIERLQFSDWVVAGMQRAMEDKGGFRTHLDPRKANYVDHDLLFGPLPEGIHLVPTSSPARIWRVTPEEHITRLNELINTEPAYDPEKPGLRAHGDAVPTNHGGELKLYFGTDRIIRWDGGTVAYATAVKSVPVVLSSARKHGFQNYPDFYSVNSAEVTRILDKAEDILKYMAYGPLSLVEFPEQITDDPATYARVKPKGDLRGLPSSIVYSTEVVRPLTPVHDLMQDPGVSDERLRAAVDHLFEALTFRPPSTAESDDYLGIVRDSVDRLGKEEGVVLGLSAVFLDRDALFRPELAAAGAPDEHGRVMLQDWELGLAVNHALRFIRPDETLRKAIVEGRMRTRQDVEREVSRMLDDDRIRKPRILRFFREYFDHDLAGYICKDDTALNESGAGGGRHIRAMFDATASTDRLIELILAEDQDVLRELLTTRKVVATPGDRIYFGRRYTREESQAATAARRKEVQELRQRLTAELEAVASELETLAARFNDDALDRDAKRTLESRTGQLRMEQERLERQLNQARPNVRSLVAEADLTGPPIHARVGRRSFGNDSMTPGRILATAPEGQRLGILTHPSWLVSHSDAMDNDAIHRGIWIRERLLGGGIPDVPITVDAQLPDEPENTLRERMRVTREPYCWTCHQKMDPLGLPFEIYNHAGLFRTTELDGPVDASGEIIDSGDPGLDGPVADALELIERLAASQRVEQVFVRHAFRFWMGRNETLHDGPVLRAAHKAYRDSGGSMKALILSLLTSDAFLYRTVDR